MNNIECEECGQPATSQVEWETNGKSEKHFYCDECYYEINPSENYGTKSKFYSETRNMDGNIQDEDCDCEICNNKRNGLDESGVPFEYSSEGDSGEVPQFLTDQLGKLGSILAIEILSPKRIEKTAKKSAQKAKKDFPLIYCPNCGVSFEDIVMTQKAGCVKCYQVFDGILMQKHRRFSDGKTYGGKKYEPKIIWNDIDYLQNELSTAVKNQNFEQAAKLRDEMRKLQKKV